MKKSLLSLAVAFSLVSASQVIAQDGLSDSWSGAAAFGAVITAGNSDTRNISGSLNVSRQSTIYRHNMFGSIFNAEENDNETANRFDLGYKLDRQFNDVMYGFGRLRFDSDDYGNIDGRFSGTVGVGRNFIDNGKVRFDGEIGIGAHSTDYLSLDADADGVNELTELDASGGLVFLGLSYSNILSDNVSFNSKFNAEIADSNTYTVWDNSLDFRMSERLSLSVGLLSRNNSDIVGTLGEKSDTSTRIGIVYGI